uniref:Bromo domain-containing protein n=1 Tax=Mycena chlorophos TaxID=658473 RepID=A0ABQ0M7U6_MYCCL|nr:predicted protein [Mycena chlorophos]
MSRRAKAKPAEGSILERLILAQSAWEVGTGSWLKISRMLGKHPLLAHRKTFFTAQSCHALYNLMMKESGFDLTEASHSVQEPVHLRLAEKYYAERVEELRNLILAEEQQFKSISVEIDSIRKGKNDEEQEAPPEPPEIPLDPVVPQQSSSLPQTPVPEPLPIQDPPVPSPPSLPQTPGPESQHADEQQPQSMEVSPVVSVHPEPDDDPPELALEEAKPVGTTIPVVQVDEPAEAKVKVEDPPPFEQPDVEMPIMESLDEAREMSPAPAVPTTKKRGRKASRKPTPEPEVEANDTALDLQEDEAPMSAAGRKREGKRKASFAGLDSPRDRKRIREDSEPVDDDEQGPSTSLRRRGTGRTEEQVAQKRFQTVITMVHSQISQHRNGNIFHNPIKASEAPDYHDIVKRPMDLKTIKTKIKDGVITNSLEYQRDIYLMFANAMMYNRPGSDVYTMAEDMMNESQDQISAYQYHLNS